MRTDQLGELTDVFDRRTALGRTSRHQLEWAIRSGRILTLRRGIYWLRTTYDAADVTDRHLLHSRAALASHDDRHVLSHLSAALSFGLPCPLDGPGRPTLTVSDAGASTDRQSDLIVQVASLRDQDVRPWSTGRRTSMTRTVADCLRHLAPSDAVAIADAALRSGRTDSRAVEAILRWQHAWPYSERGFRALTLTDGRRETWLESVSFVLLHEDGIELPVPQVDVYDSTGTLVGRVDGLWVEHGTVAEVDGRAKYALSAWPDLAGADPEDLVDARVEAARRALVREKVREDALRALGLEVVRWGTFEVTHRRPRLTQDIRAAWRRGDSRRFSGRLVVPAAV